MEVNASRIKSHGTEHWKIYDTLTKADGTVHKFEYENTVMEGMGKLLGALLFGAGGYNNTVYIAVGSGLASWDTTLPEPLTTEVKLTSELARKVATFKSFVDNSNAETASVTNRVKFVVDFTETEAVGDIREFGIFSGNATTAKDSGIMCNKKHHKKTIKENGDLLQRIVIVQL